MSFARRSTRSHRAVPILAQLTFLSGQAAGILPLRGTRAGTTGEPHSTQVRSAILLAEHVGTAVVQKVLKKQIPISQREPRIEQFVRQASGAWLLREASGIESSLELPSLGIVISLAEIFPKVDFQPKPIRPQAPPTG